MSVLMVSKLLLPECIDYAGVWFQMRNAKLVEDEDVNGFSCYHLVGSTLKTDDKEAWIDKDNFIVRRLKAITNMDAKEVEDQYTAMMAAIKESGMDTSMLPTPAFTDMK